MASGGEKTPASYSSRQKARLPRGLVALEGSLEHQKERLNSSSASVGINKSPQMVTPDQVPKYMDSRSSSHGSECSESDSAAAPFDICMSSSKCSIKLNRSLLELNREKRQERELSKNIAPFQYLRPGMVLLKKFLQPNDQVKIIKACQHLGIGTGGFYTPGYKDGVKLNLRMMCLGKNWDPDSRSYGDLRPFDGAQPPEIPEEFRKLVKDTIKASHEFLKENVRVTNVEEELPLMSPDICLVNFYSNNGRLGLHQDKDESRNNIAKGLPVVSFSLGDTAEFLYSDLRDADRASRVDLESGDVLLFGGKSRLVFHGVSSIKPKTAPKWLTNETNLRPGRLNLTFRQY